MTSELVLLKQKRQTTVGKEGQQGPHEIQGRKENPGQKSHLLKEKLEVQKRITLTQMSTQVAKTTKGRKHSSNKHLSSAKIEIRKSDTVIITIQSV